MSQKVNIFVHLAENKDATQWRISYDQDTLAGRNESTPYGYGRAQTMGCNIRFSTSTRENLFGKISRYFMRLILGFDYVHALRQKDRMIESDVVWTHTESQFLAVAAVLRNVHNRPKIIGQIVWLIDEWEKLNRFHKLLYKTLIKNVDILTTLSPCNAEVASKIFRGKRIEFLRFGIHTEHISPPKKHITHSFNVLGVGNDRHRDWKTLIKASAGDRRIRLTILSSTASKWLIENNQNAVITSAKSNEMLQKHYAFADVVVVPLLPNLHASGITVIQEALLAGVPVIASATGGLNAYFSEEEVTYVRAGDSSHLLDAIREVCGNEKMGMCKVLRAQKSMREGTINSENYIRRHVELSRELLIRKDFY